MQFPCVHKESQFPSGPVAIPEDTRLRELSISGALEAKMKAPRGVPPSLLSNCDPELHMQQLNVPTRYEKQTFSFG